MRVLIWTVDFSARSAAVNIYNEAKRQGFDVEIAGTRTNPAEFVTKLNEWHPAIVFNFCIRPNLTPVYKLIRESGAKLISWYPDMTESRRNQMWLHSMKGQADCLLFSIGDTAIRYACCAPVSLWVPQYFNVNDACLENMVERLDITKPIYDLCFMGSVDANRRKWLEELAANYKTKFIIDPFTKGGAVHNKAMADIYAQSKVAIGIQRTLFCTDAPYVTSNRIYNAMGGGAFYLTYPITKLDALFVNGSHLAVYQNETIECLRKEIDFWLENERLREWIAAEGQRQVLRFHTLRQRVPEYWRVFELLHTNNVDQIRANAKEIWPYLDTGLYDLAIHTGENQNV